MRFEQPALEATLAHYLEEVDHAAEQIIKLEKAVDEAVAQAGPEIRSVIEALQALRGVAQMTAATIVCELGSLSLPLASVMIALGFAVFGMIMLMQSWRHQAETQLRLDECVGKTAARFRDINNSFNSGSHAAHERRPASARRIL